MQVTSFRNNDHKVDLSLLQVWRLSRMGFEFPLPAFFVSERTYPPPIKDLMKIHCNMLQKIKTLLRKVSYFITRHFKEGIFTTCIINTVLISRIYHEHLQISKKSSNNLIEKWAKDLHRSFNRKGNT